MTPIASRPRRSLFGLSDQGRERFTQIRQSNALPRPRVLDVSQFTTLELLADTIHPADKDFPGAVDWRVADYIDILLSESDALVRRRWLSGLAELDRESDAAFGLPFGRLGLTQRHSLVAEIYRAWSVRERVLEAFIEVVDLATVCACFAAEASVAATNAAETNTGH